MSVHLGMCRNKILWYNKCIQLWKHRTCSLACQVIEEHQSLSVVVECHPVAQVAVGGASHQEDGDEGEYTETKVQGISLLIFNLRFLTPDVLYSSGSCFPRPASPLPPNVPTGPRNQNKYKDRDGNAPAVDGLDYGGGKDLMGRRTPSGEPEERISSR
jgi:hypothetical protein